jgi:hypothetical protein
MTAYHGGHKLGDAVTDEVVQHFRADWDEIRKDLDDEKVEEMPEFEEE